MYEIPVFCITRIAGADLSDKQYYAVKQDANGQVVLCDTQGEDMLGILQNAPKSGEAATIMVLGVSRYVAGAAVATTDKLMVDAQGRLIPYAAPDAAVTHHIVGKPIESAGAANEYSSVLLGCDHPFVTG